MQQTITAERTVLLVKRSPLNPLRRLLRQRLPTYSAPLIAEALVTVESEGDMPALRIEDRDKGRFSVALIAKPGVEYFVSRVTLRERGDLSGTYCTPEVERRTTTEQGLRDAGQKIGEMTAHVFEGIATGRAQGGVVKPGTTLVGTERGGESFIRTQELAPGAVFGSFAKVKPDATDAEKYAFVAPATDAPPVVPTLDPGASAAAYRPSWMPTPAPTTTTSVLHDLQHVAELLETAQTEIAMSPGGDAAGTTGNSAWRALKAVETIQQKVLVMAEAADEAGEQIKMAQRRQESTTTADTGTKRSLNRAASMLRLVTDRLPTPTPKDA